MGHRYSLAFLTVFDLGPVEAIRVAAETGYDLIGLRFLPAAPTEPAYPILTDDAVLAEVAAALARGERQMAAALPGLSAAQPGAQEPEASKR